MILSESWLREWVNPDLESHELAHRLTMAGLEVDAVTTLAEGLSGVVVAEIVAAQQHPDADKLKVCSVNTGSDTVQIVCGAPNAEVGLKVPLAQPGATLPGGVKIKKAKLRGVESQGMLCSAAELTLSDDHDGLLALPSDAPVGKDMTDYLNLDDRLIEIGLTPNRADCLSVLGVARDLAVVVDAPFNDEAAAAVEPTIDETFPVTVLSPEKCPRYLGRVIRDIDIARPTPLFMVERLRRSGIRSIDPVVDITNYVMLELGQPLHAFNLEALEGGIVVREAESNEALTLLDGQAREMTAGTLMIADQVKPLAMAGIMGGEGSGVDQQTRHLFLEAAFFTPELMAGRARQYGLHTDASHRYERGVDPELPYRAIERATALLLEWVGGNPGPVIDISATEQLPLRAGVTLRASALEAMLGIEVPADEVTRILRGLGFEVVIDSAAQEWCCTAPSWRFDMGLEADLIEEIARIFGYDNIPTLPVQGASQAGVNSETTASLAELRHRLVSRGFNEAITFSFVSPSAQRLFDPDSVPVALKNPISSDLAVMRTSLLPGLAGAAAHNIKRQISRIRLFETGLRFLPHDNALAQTPTLALLLCGARSPEGWSAQPSAVDFYDLKGEIEALLAAAALPVLFRPAVRPGLHDGQTAEVVLGDTVIGILGRLHPTVASELDLPDKTFVAELDLAEVLQRAMPDYQDISRYPEVRRDLAVVLDKQVAASAALDLVKAVAGEHLADVVIFDLYEGEGVAENEKSLAMGLTFRDQSRTLTDEEVSNALAQVIDSLKEKLGARLRH
ncbi:phenylalanine--tRNA ligase subunit beta [Luminiphilus sp.]|nr:phenylalanine--tRNA ligase subunit beta [Luminiphilus sp.]